MASQGIPDDLVSALDLVRGLWAEGRDCGLTEKIVAWAMIIEAVDRLTALCGPAVTAETLAELSDAVLETQHSGPRTLQ